VVLVTFNFRYLASLVQRRKTMTLALDLELKEQMDQSEKRLQTWPLAKLVSHGITMQQLEPSFAGG
jgi:hypothetical protein